jgi:hypothetical protein
MSTNERSFNVSPSLVVGICLIVVGGALVLDRMQLLSAAAVFRYWPVAIILFGVSVVVQALRGGDPGIAGRRGGLGGGHVLALILVAALVARTLGVRPPAMRSESSDVPHLFAVMSGDQRVSHAGTFRGAEMTSIMGGCELDLRQTNIAPGEAATIDIFTLMGGLVLRVPPGWIVDVQTVPVMGGVNDERAGINRITRSRRSRDDDSVFLPPVPAPVEPTPDAAGGGVAPVSGPAPRLVVRGFIMMGGLVIKS